MTSARDEARALYPKVPAPFPGGELGEELEEGVVEVEEGLFEEVTEEGASVTLVIDSSDGAVDEVGEPGLLVAVADGEARNDDRLGSVIPSILIGVSQVLLKLIASCTIMFPLSDWIPAAGMTQLPQSSSVLTKVELQTQAMAASSSIDSPIVVQF